MMETELCLPPEILLKIFEFLPASDVANCSLVCIQWREEINRNKLWRGLSLQNKWCNVWDEPNLLDSYSHVVPAFKVPEYNSESRLSPLCPWHVQFLGFAHVYNNWKNNRYVMEELSETCPKHSTPRGAVITTIDANHSYIFLGNEFGHVMIWKNPYKKPEFVDCADCLFLNIEIAYIYASDEASFGVIQLGLLQVYHKSDLGKYGLCYVKAMIDSAPNLPQFSPGSINEPILCWFIDNIEAHFDFKGFHSTRAEEFRAFWGSIKAVDILSLNPGGSLKTLQFPYETYKVHSADFGDSDDDVIYVAVESNAGDFILEYNFKTNVCLKQFKASSTILFIHVIDSYIFSVDQQGTFTKWSCVTGNEEYVIPLAGLTLPNTSLELTDDVLVYQIGNTIVSLEFGFGKIQFHSLEVEPSSKFLFSCWGHLLVLQNNKDLIVRSWMDKTWKCCFEGILSDSETAEICSNMLSLVICTSPPKLIWFY